MSVIIFSEFPIWFLCLKFKINLVGTNVIFLADQCPRPKRLKVLLQLKCNKIFVQEPESKIFTTDFNLVITKSSPISIQRSPTCTMMITAFDDSRVQFHMNMVKPIMSHSSPKMLFPAQPLTMLLLVGKPLPQTYLWRFFEVLEIFSTRKMNENNNQKLKS